MNNNNNLALQTKQKSNVWVYTLLLFVSFIWISIYPTTNVLVGDFTLGYGNLFDIANPNFSFIALLVVLEAFFSFIIFEFIFFVYRKILEFRIYSFIVPADKLKIDSRIYFIYRNILLGIFVNLCFFHPYLYMYVGFADIIITMIMVILYALHLNKAYAEPIISHFVFKNFCYPIFIFEALMLLIQFVGVL